MFSCFIRCKSRSTIQVAQGEETKDYNIQRAILFVYDRDHLFILCCFRYRILQQFTFDQKKTKVSELVDFVTALMGQARSTSTANLSSTAQLLLIVSDGRGLFSEGSECVHQAIRRAKQAGLFMVFVILDNPDSKDSILDIRVPIFDPTSGKLEGIKPYLDSFPFPFYVILRDIQTLPVVLSDALRQWFELVTSSSSI